MPWLVVFMTVIFPLLLVVLLVVDLLAPQPTGRIVTLSRSTKSSGS
jgi:hypothetical protein